MKECSTVSFKGQVIYCGIDVHKKSWHVTIRHCCHQIENFTMRQGFVLIWGSFQSRINQVTQINSWELQKRGIN